MSLIIMANILFLILCFLSIEVLTQTICPTGFKIINQNKCVKIFAQKLKHFDAEEECKNYGGTLVTIKNALDNRAIATLAASAYLNTVWLGLFCFGSGNDTSCYHDDNSGPMIYSNFQGERGNGGCVFMQAFKKPAGGWTSTSCAVAGMPFICEVPMTNPDPTCSHNYNGYCYMPSHELVKNAPASSFLDARAICASNGADLVSIHSKLELDYVRALYRNTETRRIYLGAEAWANTIHWIDRTMWDYDNRNPLARNNGSCLSMDLALRPNAGLWSRTSCEDEIVFLCKRRNPGIEVAPVAKAIAQASSKSPTHVLDASNCNTTLFMSPGIVTSFGYPDAKPPVTTCTWNLAALGPYRIGLYFTDFSLCLSLYIYDENGNLLGEPGYDIEPFQLLAPGNVVTMTHDSNYDAKYGYHGFSATVLPF